MKCEYVKNAANIPTEESSCLDFSFNTMEYAEAYGGRSLACQSTSSAIYIRGIAGTDFFDGRLPWPYIKLPETGGLPIRKEFPELITVTGVITPSAVRPSSLIADHELIPFKQHFVFEPSLGPIRLSKKSATNLRKGARVWRTVDANSGEGWGTFADLYRDFASERKLTGGFYAFGDEHFHRLSAVNGIRLFGVKSLNGWGAMACGARYDTELHLMHICVSPHGYASHASYVLMDAITGLCETEGVSLFMGGLPQGAGEGLLRFKKRWTNKTLLAWLLKMVIRQDAYDGLVISGNRFFPGYRQTYSTDQAHDCPTHVSE